MYVLSMKDFLNNLNKKEQLTDFLNKHKINNISDEIFKNMSFIYMNDVILGTMSYEKYCNIALLRSFIYNKDLNVVDIKRMFKNICTQAKENNCEYLMAFSLEDEEDVFLFLGFKHIDESKVYIEEESFLNSKYKNRKTYLFSLL